MSGLPAALAPSASRYLRRLAHGLAAVALLGALWALVPGEASAAVSSKPLLWTAPAGVETSPIDSLSCPSVNLCVGVDRDGRALWSTHPEGGARAWRSGDIDGAAEMTGIACPARNLCVAVAANGDAVTSTDPTAGKGAWTAAKIDTNTTENNSDNGGSILLRGVSCPATSLCVAVDAAGDALTSSAPTAGPAGWTATHVDTNRTRNCTGSGLACQPPLVGVSCPSTSECAAVDFAGNVLTSQDPRSTGSPWASTTTDGGALSSLYGISCPTSAFCASVDGSARNAITFNPASAFKQVTRALPYSLDGIWCASRTLCLASVQTEGGVSGLLGSFDPASPASTWSFSSLGGVNAVACPRADVCLAADDDGNIAAGVTTRAAEGELSRALLARHGLPTIAKLDRTHSDRLTMTSPIAASVSLSWTAQLHGRPVLVGSDSHRFTGPGKAHLTLRLTSNGRALFRAATKLVRVSAAATFAASTGSVRKTAKLTISHPRKR